MNIRSRSDRFEMVAACDESSLVELAESVLDSDVEVEVLQEPKPQLVMQRVEEPVEAKPFNLGEVLVTAAEVEIEGEKGFAMVAGKAKRKTLSGAIVDAAVEAELPEVNEAEEVLEAGIADRKQRRSTQWSESRATAVEFESMEDEL
ncbi:MAG: phosphonate C-P lyase system protein PhnG [Halobacteria archaeon]|nr:phosphonate C-P lyase system protein PhnG [Halobacteria archaeon]